MSYLNLALLNRIDLDRITPLFKKSNFCAKIVRYYLFHPIFKSFIKNLDFEQKLDFLKANFDQFPDENSKFFNIFGILNSKSSVQVSPKVESRTKKWGLEQCEQQL